VGPIKKDRHAIKERPGGTDSADSNTAESTYPVCLRKEGYSLPLFRSGSGMFAMEVTVAEQIIRMSHEI